MGVIKLDKYDFLMGFSFLLLIALGIIVYTVHIVFEKQIDEQECVSYYEEHGYVLNACEKFEDKLLILDLDKGESEK